jgi:hypothetical protein
MGDQIFKICEKVVCTSNPVQMHPWETTPLVNLFHSQCREVYQVPGYQSLFMLHILLTWLYCMKVNTFVHFTCLQVSIQFLLLQTNCYSNSVAMRFYLYLLGC